MSPFLMVNKLGGHRRRPLLVGISLAFLVANISFVFVFVTRPQALFCVESFFAPPLTQSDKAVFRRTLDALVGVLESINATYFMTSGTLIGSYRHHGFIPWDDDLDIMIGKASKTQLHDALTRLQPDYVVYPTSLPVHTQHWKLFSSSETKQVILRPYRWPYIDVFFFDEDDRWVWNESPWFADERWLKVDVFPLVRRPFDGLWLPAPCDTAAVLAVNFKVEDCASRARSHSYDFPLAASITVPCSVLHDRFPFVRRQKVRDARENVEVLKIGSRTLNTLDFPSSCLASSERNEVKPRRSMRTN